MSEATTTQTTSGAPLVLHGLAGLQERLGTNLGVSSWRSVTQDDITTFAKLTGDEQWIHVDPERAKTGMFGRTIQHGFLTLGLATGFLWEVCTIDGFGVVLNYGLNKVRFPAPVPSGSRLRGRFKLLAYEPLEGGAQLTVEVTMEREGSGKPVCVAESVTRRYV